MPAHRVADWKSWEIVKLTLLAHDSIPHVPAPAPPPPAFLHIDIIALRPNRCYFTSVKSIDSKLLFPGPLSALITCATLLFQTPPAHGQPSPPFQFAVTCSPALQLAPTNGRLFVVLGSTDKPEPRLSIGQTERGAPTVLALDVTGYGSGHGVTLDQAAFSYPLTNLSQLPAGDYFVQALFDWNPDLRLRDAPGNAYSPVKKLHLDGAHGGQFQLELTQKLAEEQVPSETEQVKFVRLESKLLSQFYHRPIFLRAGVILPKGYGADTTKRYPLWVRIGGLNTRYTVVSRQMSGHSEFATVWNADDTPRFILLQLDGAGPNGDPYQVNSANNGPYGDAVTQELIPFVESQFHAVGTPNSRVLSGVSTGGWVSLALQVFYPDFFNGVWSSSPDPVDFHAYELVNLYGDDNAYVNNYGNERPSDRDLLGDVRLTMRREVSVENLLGRGNCYVNSGEQWGEWNQTFSPRGPDGKPLLIWDPQTGRIDHRVAERWKKYDLHQVLESDWRNLSPKLSGKLHIAAGEADDYFLNNAVHLLDKFLAQANPHCDYSIHYAAGKGHGWSNVTLKEMLQEMSSRTGTSR